jgi:ADP-ribose pyrophosphatase YjhB (NUDIX family)
MVSIKLSVANSFASVSASIARPEYMYGVTFAVVGTEHDMLQTVPAQNRRASEFSGLYVVHPLTQEHIPVWVADRTDEAEVGLVHLAVPAHDVADNNFARQHGLPIVPVVAQDFGQPLADAKDVSGVVVIGYDPASKQYMGLKNGPQGWLVGGGHEDGESYPQTARRELAEEAGFDDVIKLLPLGDPVYSYYYNDIKRSNRRSLGYNYLAVVDRAQQHEQHQEAHESFEVWWTDFDTLYADIEKTGGGVEHWLEALKRAKMVTEAYDRGQEHVFVCYDGQGTLVNSCEFDGLASNKAGEQILARLPLL